MRRLALVLCLLAASRAQAGPPVHIDLPGDHDGWLSTFIVLVPGDTLRVSASGCICFAAEACPTVEGTNPDGSYCWDPSQWPNYPDPPVFTCESGRQLSLVAKIGDHTCFTVGSSFSTVVVDGGELFVAFNDRPGGFADNYGSFSIDISGSYLPLPGACCFPDSRCMVGSRTDCEALGGSYLGDGVSCRPGPCGAIATTAMSWGRVKTLYR